MAERYTPMPQLVRRLADRWAEGCWLSTTDREVMGSNPVAPTSETG